MPTHTIDTIINNWHVVLKQVHNGNILKKSLRINNGPMYEGVYKDAFLNFKENEVWLSVEKRFTGYGDVFRPILQNIRIARHVEWADLFLATNKRLYINIDDVLGDRRLLCVDDTGQISELPLEYDYPNIGYNSMSALLELLRHECDDDEGAQMVVNKFFLPSAARRFDISTIPKLFTQNCISYGHLARDYGEGVMLVRVSKDYRNEPYSACKTKRFMIIGDSLMLDSLRNPTELARILPNDSLDKLQNTMQRFDRELNLFFDYEHDHVDKRFENSSYYTDITTQESYDNYQNDNDTVYHKSCPGYLAVRAVWESPWVTSPRYGVVINNDSVLQFHDGDCNFMWLNIKDRMSKTCYYATEDGNGIPSPTEYSVSFNTSVLPKDYLLSAQCKEIFQNDKRLYFLNGTTAENTMLFCCNYNDANEIIPLGFCLNPTEREKTLELKLFYTMYAYELLQKRINKQALSDVLNQFCTKEVAEQILKDGPKTLFGKEKISMDDVASYTLNTSYEGNTVLCQGNKILKNGRKLRDVKIMWEKKGTGFNKYKICAIK